MVSSRPLHPTQTHLYTSSITDATQQERDWNPGLLRPPAGDDVMVGKPPLVHFGASTRISVPRTTMGRETLATVVTNPQGTASSSGWLAGRQLITLVTHCLLGKTAL